MRANWEVLVHWVYILKCADDSYYTGTTENLELRVAQHQIGEGSDYTSARLPITLVYAREFQTHDEAFRWERQIKGWSRKKKKTIISGNYDALIELSKNRGGQDTRRKRI
jgi:putative endonuclease